LILAQALLDYALIDISPLHGPGIWQSLMALADLKRYGAA